MSDVVVSPDMNLPVPVVSQEVGPDWATDINACMSAIDSHDHSTGKGVQIGVAGINVDGDLTLNSNNLTSANSVGFSALLAAVTSLLRTLQVVSKDLYYIDGDGNAVRITQGGSVTGATGTITGLPSGTASAAYSGGTFTFNSATNTKATMSVGPVAVGSTTASGKQTTISSAGAMPANLSLVLPQAAGAASSILSNDGSSNTTWSAITAILTAAGVGSSQTSTATVLLSAVGAIAYIDLTAGTWVISANASIDGSPVSPLPMYWGVNTVATLVGTTDGLNKFLVAGTSPDSFSMAGYVVTPAVTTRYYFVAAPSGATSINGTISAIKLGA